MRPIPDFQLSIVLIAICTAAGLAQSGDADALRGPTVTPRGVPGVQEQYVAGDLGRFAGRERPTPLPAFIQVLREIASPDAPEEVRLSAEQLAAIRAELRGFARDAGAFLDTHGAEVRALAAELPKEQRPRAAEEFGALERASKLLNRIERTGGLGEIDPQRLRARADPEPGQPTEEARPAGGFRLNFVEPGSGSHPGAGSGEAMMHEGGEGEGVSDRLRALRAAAPSVSAVETRVWQVLSEAQREHVGAALDAQREAETRRVQEQRMERQLAERRASAEAAGVSNDLKRPAFERMLAGLEGGEIPPELWGRLPERVRMRLESLPEEQRPEALRRFLRSRLEAEQAPARKPKTGG